MLVHAKTVASGQAGTAPSLDRIDEIGMLMRASTQAGLNLSSLVDNIGERSHGVVDTMNRIHASSRQIGDIISVIDGTAFQTNILALNVAMEAARAGEQGRGIAVVASGAHSLAQRSAEAAKEIRELISVSSARVEEGARQGHGAGRSMRAVVTSIEKVSQRIAEP